MADYYPLIARAIAGLDPSAPGESRRALYERARAALIAQLRSVQPPLSESEITRERLSLEEAVRKVESEAAQRAREASRAGGGALAAAMLSAAPTPRPPEAAPAPGAAAAAPRAVRRQRAAARPSAARRRGRPRPPRNLRPDAPPRPPRPQPPVPMQDPQLPPTRERSGAPRRGPTTRAAAAAAAGHARLPRHRRRRRRSRPRRGAGQPHRAKNLRQRAVALAGIRPARAEHGEPRRRSGCALFLRRVASRRPSATRPAAADAAAAARSRIGGGDREPKKRARTGAVFPFKSAIAVGVVLILVGAGILWGKSAGHDRAAACSSRRRDRAKRRRTLPRRRRSRRFPIASASRRRRNRSRRWRSASCCMTRIRPIPRASNMSAR